MQPNFMYSMSGIFTLGVVVMALLYHYTLYLFNKDELLKKYLNYLLGLTIFIFIYSDALPIFFGNKLGNFIYLNFREGFQILYLFLYFNFIMQSLNFSKNENPFLYKAWRTITFVLLLYACTNPFLRLISIKVEWLDLLFILIRIFIFVLTFIMLFKSFQVRHITFQKFILLGCSLFFVCGLISFLSAMFSWNKYHKIDPIEFLFLGCVLDIILFSAAMGYRYRSNMQEYNRVLLSDANHQIELQKTLIEKQHAVEQERSRIATDMHDDLGSGLTKITYLSQMALTKQNTRDDLQSIKKTSTELVENMSEIIWAMKEENNSLEDLIYYIKNYALEYCTDNNLNCNFYLSEKLYTRIVAGQYRRNIYLAVKEALHNIVKHSKAKNVVLTASFNNQWVISIKDDGIGFVTTTEQKNIGGNGLKNIYKRIEAVSGSVDIKKNNGTEIIFYIPL